MSLNHFLCISVTGRWLTLVENFVLGSIFSLWVYQSTKRTSLNERANTSAYSRIRARTRSFCSSERSSPISIFSRISLTLLSANGSRVHAESLVPQSSLNPSVSMSPIAWISGMSSMSLLAVASRAILCSMSSLLCSCVSRVSDCTREVSQSWLQVVVVSIPNNWAT